jgi:hypothetical protein
VRSIQKFASLSVLLSLCAAPAALAKSESESISELLQDDPASPIRFDFNYGRDSSYCGIYRDGYCSSSRDKDQMSKIIQGMVQDKVDGLSCSIEFLKQTKSLVEDAVKSYPAVFAKANVTVKPYYSAWPDRDGKKSYAYSMKLLIQLPTGGTSVIELVKDGKNTWAIDENRSTGSDCKFTSMSGVKEQLKLAAEISQLTQDPNAVNSKEAPRDAQTSVRSDSVKAEYVPSILPPKKKTDGAR